MAQGTQFYTLTYFLCTIICNNYLIVKFIEVYSDIYLKYLMDFQKLKFRFVNFNTENLDLIEKIEKKDDWPKAYSGPRLSTLPCNISVNFRIFCCIHLKTLIRGFLLLLMTILKSEVKYKMVDPICWLGTHNSMNFEFSSDDWPENFHSSVFQITKDGYKIGFSDDRSNMAAVLNYV